MVSDENVSFKEVAKLFSVDPVLAGQVLQHVRGAKCRNEQRLFHNFNLERNLQCLGRETHGVVAGLVAQFARKRRRSRRGIAGRLKMRHDLEIASEHRQRLLGEAVLFHPRLWEREAGGLQRSRIPGEAERNQVFIRGRVAVDVVPGAQFQRQRGIDRCTLLGNHFTRWNEVKDVALRERLRP
jgi:hypothetical protein